MASLQKVQVQGRTYWRIVESRRIKGKPRAIPILHLGSADALLNRLLASSEGSLTVQSFQHGDVAALKAVADRLDVVATIDRHVGGRARSPSVGTTLLLAAINRAVQPCSKRGWAVWAGATAVCVYVMRPKNRFFSSQLLRNQVGISESPASQSSNHNL